MGDVINASSLFVYNTTQRWVRSWFNRQLDHNYFSQNTGGVILTASNVPSYVGSLFGFEFLLWAGKSFTFAFNACGSCNIGGANCFAAVYWDGGIPTQPNGGNPYEYCADNTAMYAPFSFVEHKSWGTDGYHSAWPVIWVSSGATFYIGRGGGPYPSINGRIGSYS